MTNTIKDKSLADRVRAAAAVRGEDPDQYVVDAILDALLADAEAIPGYDPDDLSPEEIAESREGIRRGLEDAEAGRIIPFDEWAEQKRRRYPTSDSLIPASSNVSR